MDGTEDYHVKQKSQLRKTNVACFFFYMWNLDFKKRQETRKGIIWEEEEDQQEGGGGTKDSDKEV
jgi:hypothetical protein